MLTTAARSLASRPSDRSGWLRNSDSVLGVIVTESPRNSSRSFVGVPEYVIAESGPDHAKTFEARVRIGSDTYGHGIGRSKKEAEQQAAETAWKALRAAHPDSVDPSQP